MGVNEWLTSIPEVMVYMFVGLMLAGQSVGLPLPGTIAIISAALLAAQGQTNPWLVAMTAALGSAIGHSAGYAVGRRGGEPVLDRLNGRAPQAKSLQLITRVRSAFARWGDMDRAFRSLLGAAANVFRADRGLAAPWLDGLALAGLAMITALLMVQFLRYIARYSRRVALCRRGAVSAWVTTTSALRPPLSFSRGRLCAYVQPRRVNNY